MSHHLRRLRLGSGLILFVFVTTHFLNHALGLVSLEVLEAGRELFLRLWRNWPATILLYAALLLHMALALWAVYQRRSLSMPPWELTQLLLGLAIPPLLTLHILGTRLAFELFGVEDDYHFILLIYFVFAPFQGIKQGVVMLFVWLHGCVGLHFWLRLKPWYPQVRPQAFALALLIPVISLLGVLVAGRDLARLAEDPAWLEATMARINFPGEADSAWIGALENAILAGLAVTLAVTFGARWLRAWRQRRRGIVTVTYPNGRRVTVLPGTSLLEASRSNGIPHASVCGGRGRCSTCRVRVSKGLERLAPAAEAELKVLARVGAAPNVRLACQTRPRADLEVTPLLPPTATPREAWGRPGMLQGQEREVAILFADLRGFTTLSENKLPYDVVFVLNRYFAAMGKAIEESGGHLDKFIGDGVMALFGIEGDPRHACRDALAAARGMAEHLVEINKELSHDLDRPLRIGIGIHAGPVILGEMGYGSATSVTAIGDAVNTASRLESLTKDYGAQLVFSEPVADRAGLDLGAFPREQVEVRGREGLLTVRVVSDAALLPGAA
ncbi:MAG: adenylate/guanylate cyclase domain-containing protein [Kiloniellales bacterium]|nr:adenylate/guanylate cyclase domain-containing protein [Kiloniellales bacterium]